MRHIHKYIHRYPPYARLRDTGPGGKEDTGLGAQGGYRVKGEGAHGTQHSRYIHMYVFVCKSIETRNYSQS